MKPLLMKDYNEDSLNRRIEDKLNGGWYLVKRGDTFEHDIRAYWAIMKRGDDTFVRSKA